MRRPPSPPLSLSLSCPERSTLLAHGRLTALLVRTDSVVLGLFILLGCALAYFPPHLAHVLQRWRYYLSGSDL